MTQLFTKFIYIRIYISLYLYLLYILLMRTFSQEATYEQNQHRLLSLLLYSYLVSLLYSCEKYSKRPNESKTSSLRDFLLITNGKLRYSKISLVHISNLTQT